MVGEGRDLLFSRGSLKTVLLVSETCPVHFGANPPPWTVSHRFNLNAAFLHLYVPRGATGSCPPESQIVPWEQRVHGRGGFVLDLHLLTVALPCCRRGALHWLAGGALRSYSQHGPAIPNTVPSFKLLQEFRWLVDTANPPNSFLFYVHGRTGSGMPAADRRLSVQSDRVSAAVCL